MTIRLLLGYPLSEFKPKIDHENFELGYLSGRYGALPFIDFNEA